MEDSVLHHAVVDGRDPTELRRERHFVVAAEGVHKLLVVQRAVDRQIVLHLL